ncbi:tumor necrosis factor receptor superfamily member 5 [Labrus bergylta]|uniref:tumor necrosis factor receptor superfamily member 5 n=1 Tax=Labrus bergylta TaxID=56723 RepID=UPI0033138DF9
MEGLQTKMQLLLICAFLVITAGQPHCNPENQYEKNGQCCKMCVPGTRMSSIGTGTCDEPQCVDCGENEYQDAYTIERNCQRQPFCDPNKNFKHIVHENKKKKTICMCEQGFHCSSKECITCVPHTVCPPGEGAKLKGSHTHDTVCETCPVGTFSSESSWDSVCQKWTECESDYHIKEAGTAKSDNICEKDSRLYGIGIGIGILILIVLIGVVCYKVLVKRGQAEGKFKSCVEPCWGEKHEPLREVKAVNPTEEESMLQEECNKITPEENEDDQSLEESSDVRFTVNGQRVQQDSKTEHVSQEESQISI